MNPQPKRHRPHHNQQRPATNPLPGCLPDTSANSFQFTGHFTGLSVEVCQPAHMAAIYDNGCFGVGSQTGSAPACLWQTQPPPSEAGRSETLILFPEEAFFLHHSLRCLRIEDWRKRELSTGEIWAEFCAAKATFAQSYVCYLYLRSLNWVVKAGLKFGGVFLLYKEGPRHFHASYVVLVRSRTADSAESRVPQLDTHQMQGHHRVAEASKKELLIMEITFPAGLSSKSPAATLLEALTEFTACEFVPKRFNIHQERASDQADG